MEFIEKLIDLSEKIRQQGSSISTEEATKNAFVMPFLSLVLGYDVFDPQEVIPEFRADTGVKKGEKVDYAILKDGEIQMLVECKKYGENLTSNHASQLYRYFSVTNARIAILTNGSHYKFFTDLDAPNKMDEKPFLELDLEDIDEYVVPEIIKLSKHDFDVESIISTAEELKYLNQIKKIIAAQFKEPDEQFVKFFASRTYDGMITQKVKQQFIVLTKKALAQFLNDKINDRLKSALESEDSTVKVAVSEGDSTQSDSADNVNDDDNKIVTTEEEIEGFHIVKAIIREVLDSSRIAYRDTQSYFGILLDDNNRKPLCRLHFNRSQKYIGIFDDSKKETRHPIENLDDIFNYADDLKATVAIYE